MTLTLRWLALRMLGVARERSAGEATVVLTATAQ
jgi:hypothetical protein